MSDILRQSQIFAQPLREPPQDAETMNHRLLVQAGFVDQLMAGVFSYLPLGLRVLTHIKRIIRQEMNALGASELLLPALHPKEPWAKTGRWDDPGPAVMFRLKGRGEKEYGLGWTHEEIITPLMKKWIRSYRDLPCAVFQIQTKFRDEPRARSGLIRGREFLMKDLYSFHANEEDLLQYYQRVQEAYLRIFQQVGLPVLVTEASGGAFAKYSHEFQVLAESGEDHLRYCKHCGYAQNVEITSLNVDDPCPKCTGTMQEGRGIEVGNIFQLKERFASAFDVTFADADGSAKPVLMGCYGLGPSRVMGAIVERHHDERGIIWPSSVAPFAVHVLAIAGRAAVAVRYFSLEVAERLAAAGYSILFDDREHKSPGEKFADADLIGIPWRVVISEKHQGARTVGVKGRRETAERSIPLEALLATLESSRTTERSLSPSTLDSP